jgi:gas vesicle protein
MQDSNPHCDNKFFSGFLIGLILGAAAVFLFGTKKGKQILKTISEEGLENITKALEDLEEEEIVDQDFVEDVPEPVKTKETEISDEPKSSKGTNFPEVAAKEAEESEIVVKKSPRFFKRKK